jgi:tripartite ATP-independent transporter DctM subunit
MVATVALSGALFGTVSGSSVAAITTIGKIAGPEMRKLGYSPGISAAAVASIGGLAVLIPPSGMMVILGMVTETSIAKLLIAGLIPGVLNALVFVIIAVIMGLRRPIELPRAEHSAWKERFKAIPKLWGMAFIGGSVIITIYTGIATPTEAASFGVVAALIVAIIKRTSWRNLVDQLGQSALMTCKILILIAGMLYFSRFVALSGIADQFINLITDSEMPVPLFLLSITVLYIIMGMFMEFLGALLITLPFIWPAALALGIDPVHLGVCIVLLAEIAIITPPIGLNIFVVHGVMPDVPMGRIFANVGPFVLGFLITLLILYSFPQISLFLPNLMGK